MVIMVAIVIVMMLNDDLLKKTDDESTGSGSRKPAQAGQVYEGSSFLEPLKTSIRQ